MNTACEACGGACCMGLVIDPAKGMTADERRWLELHGYSKDDRLRINRACEKLSNGKCSVYEFRPGVCKQFSVGSDTCLFAVKTWQPTKIESVIKRLG